MKQIRFWKKFSKRLCSSSNFYLDKNSATLPNFLRILLKTFCSFGKQMHSLLAALQSNRFMVA